MVNETTYVHACIGRLVQILENWLGHLSLTTPLLRDPTNPAAAPQLPLYGTPSNTASCGPSGSPEVNLNTCMF